MLAQMQWQEMPLASPLPTAPPHPRDVMRNLLAPRQEGPGTCGWISGNILSSITCAAGNVCAHNTAYNAVACCGADAFPDCGVYPTTCLDSTDVAARCTGACLLNSGVAKCTNFALPYCVTQLWDLATLQSLLTGYACAAQSGETITAYDTYSTAGSVVTITQSTVNGPATVTVPGGNVGPATGPASGSNTQSTSSSSSSPTNSPVASSSSISGGAIAGIVVGVIGGIAIIVGLLAIIFFQKRRHRRDRERQQPNPPAMIQTPGNPPQNPQSPMTNPHSSFMSNPSHTSSSAPLTQANMAALSHQPSEVAPADSASNIGGYQGSTISQAVPPNFPSGTGSNSASQEHSGIGPLPGPQYPVGPAAFQHQNTASVMSPPSDFGSMAPVHAPSVTAYRPPGQ